jgi:hypothetical protein
MMQQKWLSTPHSKPQFGAAEKGEQMHPRLKCGVLISTPSERFFHHSQFGSIFPGENYRDGGVEGLELRQIEVS